MASYRGDRYMPMNFGGGYSRNDYQMNYGMRDGSSMMRNYNENSPNSYGYSGTYHGRNMYSNSGLDPGTGPASYCGRPMMGMNSRMSSSASSSSMYGQSFGGSDYFQSSRPSNYYQGSRSSDYYQNTETSDYYQGSRTQRVSYPVGNGRFFVPWNQRPGQFYFRPRVANRNQPKPSEQKPPSKPSNSNSSVSNQPRKRKNRKKKFNPRPREDAKKLKPWMTDEIYDEVRKKNELYVRAKNEDKPELWQEFKLLRNRVSSMIKEAKLKGGFMARKIKEEDDVEKPFSCDTCDRAFVSEEDLDTHKKEHVKCDRDGCTFEAHTKMVELHKKMFHDTGYAEAIEKLKSSDEVAKWRNERKQRFPTTENIEKRKAELAERIARGEVVETKQFGKFKRGRSDHPEDSRSRQWGSGFHQRKRRRGPGCGLAPPCSNKPQREVPLLDSDSDDESHIKIPHFPGMNYSEHTTDSPSSMPEDALASASQEIGNSVNEESQMPLLPHSSNSFKQTSELESLIQNGHTEDELVGGSLKSEELLDCVRSNELGDESNEDKCGSTSTLQNVSNTEGSVSSPHKQETGKSEVEEPSQLKSPSKANLTCTSADVPNLNEQRHNETGAATGTEETDATLKLLGSSVVAGDPTHSIENTCSEEQVNVACDDLCEERADSDDEGPSVEPILRSPDVSYTPAPCDQIIAADDCEVEAIDVKPMLKSPAAIHETVQPTSMSYGKDPAVGEKCVTNSMDEKEHESVAYGHHSFRNTNSRDIHQRMPHWKSPFDHTPNDAKGQRYFPRAPMPAGLKKHNLLDKLLANEIRHERNIILQCVRYIVRNNFFDKKSNGQKII